MPRPNLLFLYTDEQRFDTLEAYGNKQIEMPNLNRLARQSCVFDRAYVTQPVCTPSRSTLLTGLYPHTNGCRSNNAPLSCDIPCLAEMLDGGYACGHFGKWHLGDELFAQHGFDHWVSIEDLYNGFFRDGRDRSATSDYTQWLIWRGLRPPNGRFFTRRDAAGMDEQYSKPAFLGMRASQFIREHRHDPFCLYVNFLEPHPPLTGPRDGQYDPDSIALPANFENVPGAANHPKARMLHAYYRNLAERSGHDSFEAFWRHQRANYWGLCSQVDTHCGVILNTLDECGLMNNTIIVFTSDHGDMMGSHQLLFKTLMFEESTRVPMLIRLPSQSLQRRIGGAVSQIDMVPTLLELMGQTVPEHLQGLSLAGRMKGSDEGLRQDVFIEWNGADCSLGGVVSRNEMPEEIAGLATLDETAAAIRDPVRTIVTRDGRWKLNVSPLGAHELFDLGNDPSETTNLVGCGGHASLVRDLTERLRAWGGRSGDDVELPDLA